MTPPAAAPAAEKTFLGHPYGLSTLFLTEMWERFSYYGMRALLVLFMTDMVASGGLGMDDVTATAIYGLYTAAVYFLALPGGWIADRLVGQRKAVLVGGIIIAAGHFALAIPTLSAFYGGLVLVALGTGLLKPNVSAMVGDLYPEGGARRDAGFSIFYMGINLGAILGQTICPLLGEKVDWHLGFSAAGIGMVLGVIQYIYGGRHLGRAGLLADGTDRSGAWRSFYMGVGLVLGLFVLLVALTQTGVVALTLVGFARGTGVFITVLAVIYFLGVALFAGLDRGEKMRVGVIAILFLSAAVFWSGFEQAGTSLNLFAERLTDREILGWEAPAGWLQSINPIFIIVLAPVMGSLWIWLGARNPSLGAKFGLGLVFLAVGFLVLAWGASFATDGSRVSPMWLIVTYFFHTVGELCVSPVGLSSITKLAPKRLVGQMMGTWFMGAALGNLIAGLLAGMIESLPMPALFRTVAIMVGGFGLLLLILARPMRKMAGGVQ